MTSQTPGQASPGRAAYEAYCAAMDYVECQPWDDLVPEFQSAMEAAANAAAAAHMPEDWTTMLIQRDEARAKLDDARQQLTAVSYFAETWRELLADLPDSYTCHLTCAEANAAADLYRALGDEDTAASLLAAHAAYDEDGDEHYREAGRG